MTVTTITDDINKKSNETQVADPKKSPSQLDRILEDHKLFTKALSRAGINTEPLSESDRIKYQAKPLSEARSQALDAYIAQWEKEQQEVSSSIPLSKAQDKA